MQEVTAAVLGAEQTLSVVASPSWLILAWQLQCSGHFCWVLQKNPHKQGAYCLLEVFNSTAVSYVLTAQHEHVQYYCRSLFLCGMSSIKLELPFGLALYVLGLVERSVKSLLSV